MKEVKTAGRREHMDGGVSVLNGWQSEISISIQSLLTSTEVKA
jgi:hypothetical protein